MMMASVAKTAVRTARTRVPCISYTSQPQRFAHQSYGNEQSGHQQGTNEENPKRHLEHPGPEAPATQHSTQQAASSDSGSKIGNARPTIQEPKSAAEDHNADVRKHNEEMRQRADRSANQLSEKDNKVDKNFWQGDVGDIKDKGNK